MNILKRMLKKDLLYRTFVEKRPLPEGTNKKINCHYERQGGLLNNY